jgi:hypothetical protein
MCGDLDSIWNSLNWFPVLFISVNCLSNLVCQELTSDHSSVLVGRYLSGHIARMLHLLENGAEMDPLPGNANRCCCTTFRNIYYHSWR